MAPSASLKVTGSPYLAANSIIKVMDRSEQSRSLVDLRPGAFCVTYFRYAAYIFLLFPSQVATCVQAAMRSLRGAIEALVVSVNCFANQVFLSPLPESARADAHPLEVPPDSYATGARLGKCELLHTWRIFAAATRRFELPT